jgi:ATP-dependent helicase HrpB
VPAPTDLPINEALPALRDALAASRNVVLQAPPGAGKSTVVPLELLGAPWVAGRKILLLEPRRLAARAVAARMAQTLGEPVGRTVGYRMRLDTKVSRDTRLEVITEGVLTRMLQSDPALEGVAAVIFDEFHERSLPADLGLALCLQAQETLAPDLRLLVMSATLDGVAVAALLGDSTPVVSSPGRSFDVALHHVGRDLPALPDSREPFVRFLQPMAAAARRIAGETDGDLLMFLPGAPEIRRLRSLLEEGGLPQRLDVLELYGELPPERQDAVFSPPVAGRRRLTLATNVAETSLTLPGVRVVIDTGLVRRSLFDPATGMSRLVTERVSRASATQRAGRAGRVAPGDAYRLWGEGAHQGLAAFTPPEIAVADLLPLALELAAWGTDAAALRWLDPPPPAPLAQARELLQRLDALDARGRVTSIGRDMAGTGLHPRLAHLWLKARASGRGALGAQLAALLSERDLLRGSADPDLRTRLEVLRQGGDRLDRATLDRVRRTVRQLAPGASADAPADDRDAGELLAWAYPDRIAQRRGAEGGARRFLLANGRGATLPQASTLDGAALLVAVDLDDADGQDARIRLAAPLTAAQLDAALGAQVEEVEQAGYDEREQVVVNRRQRRLGALVLAERSLPIEPAAAAAAMAQLVARRGLALLPWDAAARRQVARLRFAAALPAATGWPAFDDAALLATVDDWLLPYLDGITRLPQLARVPVADALLARLSWPQRQQLDALAPTQLTVPTGSRVTVDYEDDNAPCIEVRLQEVFGLAQTPRVGGGAVPVTLKLLSPARRPVQITRDLGGFWRGSYADVRKDLRGRYPRHYWPEDPLQAEPTARAKPRGT